MRESQPSPLWGRGWPATGVFISRGRTGEGVKPVKAPYPYRKTRSLARTAAQIDKAREFRRMPTETERAAWDLLRSLRLKGFKFRRQHPVGPYIADFCCVERRLIVELDGGVHGQQSQARSDARRDAHLQNRGYTVLRLPNGIVLQAPELFVQKVLSWAWPLPGALD
ncbi:MAG TPA: endonuclease domain-containing protein [Terriglobia bacterium]|nr:endonuclease domain-containing protein [Terriglobia bacterium]